jgi:Zn-dependent peptidase ImmA (M78 family)
MRSEVKKENKMTGKEELARQALYQALKVRKKLEYDEISPISIFDFVEKCGVEVRFTDTKSMEGMYSKGPQPLILIGAFRPRGRQVYTCAHEFGHHIFDHGTKIDEIKDGKSDSAEEFLADSFAGHLLMPRYSIEKALKDRGLKAGNLNAQDVFILASYLGVGYSTLVKHLLYSLKLISSNLADQLLKSKPKDIKNDVAGLKLCDDLIYVDSFWKSRPIDLQVDNYLSVPSDMHYEGNFLLEKDSTVNRKIYQAITPGIGRFFSKKTDAAVFCRVSRKEYVGMNKFKHLEEESDE